MKSEIEFNKFRIDSDYYKKDFLINEKYLKGDPISTFKKNKKILNVKSLKLNKPFNYLSIANIELNSLNYLTTEIDYSDIPDRATYVLEENDLIISTVRPNRNAIGIIKESNRTVGTSGFTVLRIDKNKLEPYFLYAFCKTKFFIKKLIRENTATMYPAVTDEDVLNVKVPKCSSFFQLEISNLIEISYENLIQLKITYSKAEVILLEEIGLCKEFTDLKPVEVINYNVKNFKDSFGITGRLDAEYYQKKYEVVIEKIKAYKNGFEPLRIACNLKDKNFLPNENEEYKYIELSNIGKTGDITGYSIEFGKNLPSRARRLVNTNDVVISSIEGSLQSCGLIREEFNNSLCSTGFYVINSEKINSETLIVLFKSPLMQSIMKQNCSGTILTGMNKNEFQNILVPLIDINAQAKIAKLIKESFSLKKQSEHLLEVAKRAVEIAIEENEDIATKYIKDQLK